MASTEVTKVIEERLQSYELVFIISPEDDDEAVETIIDNLNKFITDGGGAISNIERWGKRKLAYPIKRFLEGNYVLAQFTLKPASSRQLEANLRIYEDILRYLLVKLSS